MPEKMNLFNGLQRTPLRIIARICESAFSNLLFSLFVWLMPFYEHLP